MIMKAIELDDLLLFIKQSTTNNDSSLSRTLELKTSDPSRYFTPPKNDFAHSQALFVNATLSHHSIESSSVCVVCADLALQPIFVLWWRCC